MQVRGNGTAVVSYLGDNLSCFYTLSFFDINFSYVNVMNHDTVLALKINLAMLGIGI